MASNGCASEGGTFCALPSLGSCRVIWLTGLTEDVITSAVYPGGGGRSATKITGPPCKGHCGRYLPNLRRFCDFQQFFCPMNHVFVVIFAANLPWGRRGVEVGASAPPVS